MRFIIRHITDKIFTALTVLSVVVLVAILAVILTPILWKGFSAVVFTGTIEFRKMQLDLFNRGDIDELNKENARSQLYRKKIYDTIDRFKQNIDAETLCDKAAQICRTFGKELQRKNMPGAEYQQLRSLSREIRDKLQTAFNSSDKKIVDENIKDVLKYKADVRFKDTSAAQLFALAEDFADDIKNIDLAKRQEYADALKEFENITVKLLGYNPSTPVPALKMNRYGATRLDIAKKILNQLLWSEKWEQTLPGKPMVKISTPRAKSFAGTEIEPLFDYIRDNFDEMLIPKRTFYWQYLIDSSTPGHYFGGVGPEILGTLLLTLAAMIFVFPIGIISAAYLAECSSDNFTIKIIRMAINTLAGVPSIVFGLFGLAFFVLYLVPLFGGPSKPCILTAALTLAVLTLPVMIRASEEAIRSVPQSYKEASLGLGAGKLRTFICVILPAALPGILTGIILSISRVAGETAPILFTGAIAFGPTPKNAFDPTCTLSYGSYDIAVGDRLAALVPHNQYGMVATLITLVFCLNIAAIIMRAKISRKLKGH